MDLTDILLSAILAVLLRREVITSDWMASRRRNVRRKFRAWRNKRIAAKMMRE